jgi:3-dehydroquinate synthase
MSESSDFLVKTSSSAYRVTVGHDVVAQHPKLHERLWVVDQNVFRLHSELMPGVCIQQEAVESAKNLDSVAKLIELLRDQGSTRQTQVVAAGGGIVQDLVTFSASCFMRGIPWTYCPTTMLSMVDSCIGGKSSINVGRYKNIAGNFYPPQEVIIDTRFCETLSAEQMAEGLCEAAKICYADSDRAFATYLSWAEGDAIAPEGERLTKLIHHSLTIKKRFIEEDEFDQGIRLLLNFGHTFGHAIEGASSYAISHGIAVGLGMLAAENCSIKLGLTAPDLPNVTGLTRHVRHLLRSIPDLVDKLKRLDSQEAIKCFLSDKKHSAEAFTLILFDQQGRLQRSKIPRTEVFIKNLFNTFENLKEQWHEIQ